MMPLKTSSQAALATRCSQTTSWSNKITHWHLRKNSSVFQPKGVFRHSMASTDSLELPQLPAGSFRTRLPMKQPHSKSKSGAVSCPCLQAALDWLWPPRWRGGAEVSKKQPTPPPLPTPSQVVYSDSVFDRSLLLLEFDFTNSKAPFAEIIEKNDFLLKELSPKAWIRPWAYTVIVLCNVEKENNQPVSSITTASWCKCPYRRSPGQTIATLKVACTNPDAANCLLTGHIWVNDHLINIRNDLCIPIRCVKCQEYGHTQDLCIRVEKCANCSSEFHQSDKCNRAPACILCGRGSNHSSTSPSCPISPHERVGPGQHCLLTSHSHRRWSSPSSNRLISTIALSTHNVKILEDPPLLLPKSRHVVMIPWKYVSKL